MAEVIRMPLLSDTMKEGIIAAWHKNIGDKVKADDVLAEVETDKATMEVMPYAEGTLLYIAVEKGKGVPVNGIMAIIGKDGEDYKSLLDNDTAVETTEKAIETPQVPLTILNKSAVLSKDATVIRMPLLSDTMKEGKIVSWLKNVGDQVKSDDVIAEVETDKATMELMPYVDGILLHIGVAAGNAAKINEIIAIIGKAGTDITPFLNAPMEVEAPASATNTNTTVPTQNTTTVAASNDRLKASPLAKKIAQEKGINLASLQGSGDGGRVIKRDLDNYKPTATSTATAPKATQAANINATPIIGQESYTDIPLTQIRKIVAQRLSDSMFSAPHFYLKTSIKMDNAIAARKSMNEVATVKISFNDLMIKACAMALRLHPTINSSWMGDFIRENHHINIGTAIALEEGLIVPVIKFADQKSLSQISAEANVLYDKARNKKIQPAEFTGNTFTISNLGMMDIDSFTAIINPPDACILAVGKIEPQPVVENNTVVIRNILQLSLSCDHRVVDGAVGAQFLKTLKSFLENPVTMLV